MSAVPSSGALCRHFGICGGCAWQDMADDAYRIFKRDQVVQALAGLANVQIDEIVEIGPGTRRRAAFKVVKRGGLTQLGFHAAASHDIVDMLECRLLTPSLWALVPRLRAMMAALLDDGEKCELFVTETANGPDLSIQWKRASSPALIAEAARQATALKLARLTANGETLATLAAPMTTFGKARVTLPPGSFLQPTEAGQAVLQARVAASVRGSKTLADLFAGCGTFALVLAQEARVHAVEQDRPSLDALEAAARATQGLKPVTTERRDLFRRPLTTAELARFDAIVLDPPRAGAAAQSRELAKSRVGRIAYVSCNPASFARDARLLVEGGYAIGRVTPVDQFLWSSHIELVAVFKRD
ncbi:MAG: class I SAM-dependent RNA methyltransferase [Rhizomicrobium sp.]